MNASSTLMVWLQVVGLLAGEVTLAVGAAAMLQRFGRSAGWRRTIWQVCLLSLLVLPVVELTGAARGLVDWLVRRAEPRLRVAHTPSVAEQSAGGELPPPVTFEFCGKVADRVARTKQSDVSAPLKFQFRGVQARPEFPPQTFDPSATSWMPSPTKREVGADSVADSLAVLYLGLVWLAGVALVIARISIAGFLLLLFRWRRQAA